jgi:hypothetical protein
MADGMSKAERDELGKLVRMNGRIAKLDVEQRAARVLADIEQELASRYKISHEAWAEIAREAEELVRQADEHIAEKCRELGIRDDFRPGLSLQWYSRGENADRNRRAELRKVAQTRVGDQARLGKLEIERAMAGQLTTLATGGLESDAARKFFGKMPTPEQLIPAMTVFELEAKQ